jgi:thiamine pyrophosphokinase
MLEFHHTYALVANGKINCYKKILPLIQQHECIIAVDGGTHHCHQMNITPDMIIGDLDSTSPEMLRHYANVPVRRFNSEKDETDLELALQSIYTPEAEKITIFAALEKRTDHTLANLHLIRRYPMKVFIETESERLFVVNGPLEIPCTPGQTVSFIHLGTPATGVTSSGLKWEMQNATFSKYYFSLANICLSHSIRLTLTSGDLLCCLQKLENNSELMYPI